MKPNFKLKLPLEQDTSANNENYSEELLSTLRTTKTNDNAHFMNKLAELDVKTTQMKKEWKEDIERQKLFKLKKKRPTNSSSISLTVITSHILVYFDSQIGQAAEKKVGAIDQK